MSAQLGAAGVDLGAMEEAPVEEALSTEAESAPEDAAVIKAVVEAPAEAAEAPSSS
jgi:small subunit ribosomal protein S2